MISAGKVAAKESSERTYDLFLGPSLPAALKFFLGCQRKPCHGVPAILSGRTTLTSGKLLLSILIIFIFV